MIRLNWLLASVVIIFTLLLVFRAAIWAHLVFDSAALAVFYIVARLHSGFDPLDPRFGSCIPPISKPRDGKTFKVIGHSEIGENCGGGPFRVTTAAGCAHRSAFIDRGRNSVTQSLE